MKVILLLGLFALAGGRWIPDYRPLESVSQGELMKEDSQMKDIDKVQFQFNLPGPDGDEGFGTYTPIPESLEDQVEALQASDATSGMQKDFGEEGVERQELVADGRFISSQSDDREDSRFMDVPADTQIVDDKEDSRFMDVPVDTQISDDPEDSRFMDAQAEDVYRY